MRFLRWSVAAGLLVASACGGSSEDAVPSASTSSTGGPSTTATATGSAPAGSELLAFTAPTIGGGEVDASIYQGRPTLLWFWAPW